MGTRSLTVFVEEDGTEIVVMYRQFDGYLEGMGKDLAEFLDGIKLVNGIPMGTTKRLANGMGCLAAQAIADFKTEVGNVYLYPAGTRDCGEEFIYTVYPQADGRGGDDVVPFIRAQEAYSSSNIIFEGTANALLQQLSAPVALDWHVCQVCGDDMKHWNHRTNHFAKHHPGVDAAV